MENMKLVNFKLALFAALILSVFVFAVPFGSQSVVAQEKDRGVAVVEEPSDSRDQGKSVIVVIGIDDYTNWKKLHTAVSDAQGVQAVLVEKFGFTTPIPPLLNKDATKSAINALVEDRLRRELKEADKLVLFFAGHGHTRVDTIGGKKVETGFVVPVEAKTGTEEQWSDYVKLDDFLETVSTLPARQVMVILDSCHSGFAVGGSMRSFRDSARYENDLASRVSRRVITSAMRDQLARDDGPLPGHSLFAGTLVDGLNWGKADLDGNGLVTSSELSLYLQQQVSQASESRQTPDFGSFHLDDRGELVISINDQTFDALKARAINALQRGRLQEFRKLTDEVVKIRPKSPESLYLQYRKLLYDRNIAEASKTIDSLLKHDLQKGTLPLSSHDLSMLYVQLPYWASVLSLPDIEQPLLLELQAGRTRKSLAVIKEEQTGDLSAHSVEPRDFIELKISNQSDKKLHVYMIKIDQDGRVTPIRIWKEWGLLADGLPPKTHSETLMLRDQGQTGISEWRFVVSTERIDMLVSPPSIETRGTSRPFELSDVVGVKTIRLNVRDRLSFR
jgi:uncharacterized caspase-like protein